MLDFVAQELVGSEDWRHVLEAYQRPETRHETPCTQGDPAVDGWLPRLVGIDGVDPAHLSRLHGKLIALGCLKFEISGKTGMQYQLTPLGRQTLQHGLQGTAETESAEVATAES
jgi:hypothetical protein